MSRLPRPSPGADTDRAIADLVREGVVASVDHGAGKAVVRIGDIETPPIDWLCSAGHTQIWNPPSVGEQVVVVTPEGDIERAFIAGGLPSSAFPPLRMGEAVAIQFQDGARLIYDANASRLELQLPGAATIVAPAGVAIEADVIITGDLQINGDARSTGTITGDQDVIAAGVSGKGHRHPPGSPLSGPPQ